MLSIQSGMSVRRASIASPLPVAATNMEEPVDEPPLLASLYLPALRLPASRREVLLLPPHPSHPERSPMPDTRETIIRIEHDTGQAEVWTPYPAVIRLMQRVGATPLDKQALGQWWSVDCRLGLRGVNFAKIGARQSKPRTEAQIQALQKAHEARKRKAGQ